ncbi:radical SAM protein [Shewanella sp. TC10]|uniref:radical SAM protein n=1 Tax=Shewanella sp. TC10 TaxID=1419739 RepID=UPI00129D5C79|nr:radical SAM protein [Shewanella sp. TC10]
MDILDFQQGPIRPPSEANSLLIRTTQGCPWNNCTFCTLYKGMDFTIRPVEDIKRDIWAAKKHYQGKTFTTCFLQDGDSFAMPTADLIDVLNTLTEAFPELTQISSYGRAQTMVKKSAAEMKAICDAGLNMLYCGMESGSVEVLRKAKKGITPNSILKSSLHAKAAGMKMMVFVILGLGGKELSVQHVTETAKLLNQINPEEIRLLSLAVKPGTEQASLVDSGKFSVLSEVEMIQEQQQLLRLLDGINSRYGNYHSINLLMELNGKLPEDKTDFLDRIAQFLQLNLAKQHNFILGRRLGYYQRLTDLNNQLLFDTVQQELNRLKQLENDITAVQQNGVLEDTFHRLRQRLI